MIFLGTIGVLAVATSAGAYLTYHGGGAGALDLATLQPPTGVSAVFPNPDVRTVDVSWSAPTEPSGITIAGYYVQSYVGVTPRPACGTSPTSLITTLTCDDTNVPSNTFTYTVTAVFRSWSATSAPSSPVTVPAPLLSSFTLAPSTPTPLAGTSFTVAITAVDQYGEIDTLYSGAECLTFSGAATSPGGFAPSYPDPGACSSGSAVTFVNGVASGANSPQITLFDAQSLTLTATDNPTSVDGTTSLSVLSSQATTFAVANPGTQTVGVAFNDTITALDAYGNTATAYTGAQSLNFSGPSNSPNTSVPTYPSSVTFNAGVGDATGIVLVDAETTTLTATQGALTGTSTSFLVDAGQAMVFTVANPGPQTVGVPFTDTISALDSYGNVATSYAGPQTLVFSGPSNSPDATTPTYPTSVTFSAGEGEATGITLVDAQTTTLTATQGALTGTSTSFVVSAGSATYFAVAVPPAATVDDPFSVTITAFDSYANVASGYDGTANLVPASGDVSPTSVTLVNGTVEFQASLDTPGNQTITATDSVTAAITGESGVIVVSLARPPPTASFTRWDRPPRAPSRSTRTAPTPRAPP